MVGVVVVWCCRGGLEAQVRLREDGVSAAAGYEVQQAFSESDFVRHVEWGVFGICRSFDGLKALFSRVWMDLQSLYVRIRIVFLKILQFVCLAARECARYALLMLYCLRRR